MTITSNTLVKNGMPFIGKVLKQVAPYMDEMIITISKKSNDGTAKEIEEFLKDYMDKVTILWEDVKTKGELTRIENDMVKISTSDWILFLSDDDYWPEDQLKLCLEELDKDENILAYSVNPYQLIDFEHYDYSWRNKSFSKFLRRKGLKFIKLWPLEVPADMDNKRLYWKTNKQVKRLPYKFYHLSYLKDYTFRDEEWASKFRQTLGKPVKLPKSFKDIMVQ